VFIDRVLRRNCRRFPALKIVFEHITTAEAVAFVDASGPNIAATVTPQHLVINRNALFDGGLRPHAYCLPVAKRERHRLAVRKAGDIGSPRYFLGTDSAPHAVERKEADCGCAGIFNAPFALECYASVFEEEGALDRLEAFASGKRTPFLWPAAQRGTDRPRSVRRSQVPETLPAGETRIVPFRAGETLPGGWSSPGYLRNRGCP
jgi:dihydroorotase